MDGTSAHLRSLLDRLKEAQHALIEDAARQPGLPSTAIIRRIAELENVIAAVLALIEERQGRRHPIRERTETMAPGFDRPESGHHHPWAATQRMVTMDGFDHILNWTLKVGRA